MNRHKEKRKTKLEWDKINYKILIEEINISKKQIWNNSYYTILLFSGLFAVINILNDKNICFIYIFYYLVAMLIATISVKILNKLFINIKFYQKHIERIGFEYNIMTNLSKIDRFPNLEDVYGIYFTILISYVITLIYIFSNYSLKYSDIVIIFINYIIIEWFLVIERKKDKIFRKYYRRYDFTTNIMIIGLFLVVIFFANIQNIINRSMGLFK
jgi:hypothetical protein